MILVFNLTTYLPLCKWFPPWVQSRTGGRRRWQRPTPPRWGGPTPCCRSWPWAGSVSPVSSPQPGRIIILKNGSDILYQHQQHCPIGLPHPISWLQILMDWNHQYGKQPQKYVTAKFLAIVSIRLLFKLNEKSDRYNLPPRQTQKI